MKENNELEKVLENNWLSVYDGISIEEYEAIDATEEILSKEQVKNDGNEAK